MSIVRRLQRTNFHFSMGHFTSCDGTPANLCNLLARPCFGPCARPCFWPGCGPVSSPLPKHGPRHGSIHDPRTQQPTNIQLPLNYTTAQVAENYAIQKAVENISILDKSGLDPSSKFKSGVGFKALVITTNRQYFYKIKSRIKQRKTYDIIQNQSKCITFLQYNSIKLPIFKIIH